MKAYIKIWYFFIKMRGMLFDGNWEKRDAGAFSESMNSITILQNPASKSNKKTSRKEVFK